MLTQGFVRFLRARRTDLLAIVRQFTPNWFAATMGTGILALDLNQLPGLHRPAMALWLLNIVLFALFTLLYAARWLLYPREAARIFGHSVMSMFLGTIPMGLATIINGFIAFGLAPLGPEAVGIATALWWVDAALSVVIGIFVPFLMVIRQDHAIEKMTAVWLLPVVAAEVAAASGAQIVPHLASPHLALLVDILSYALWAYSVPVALGIVAVLLLRLVLHRLPHRDMAPSSWLTLGPIGTGALGLLLLGADAQGALAPLGLPGLADAARGIGLIGGVILWGYGVWWLAFAVLATLRYLRGGIPFNLGWWGFTFPLGVFTSASFALGAQTGAAVFTMLAVGQTAVVGVFWVMVAARTLAGAFRGELLHAPCLAQPQPRGEMRIA